MKCILIYTFEMTHRTLILRFAPKVIQSLENILKAKFKIFKAVCFTTKIHNLSLLIIYSNSFAKKCCFLRGSLLNISKLDVTNLFYVLDQQSQALKKLATDLQSLLIRFPGARVSRIALADIYSHHRGHGIKPQKWGCSNLDSLLLAMSDSIEVRILHTIISI